MFIEVRFEFKLLGAVYLSEEAQTRVSCLAQELYIRNKLQARYFTTRREPAPTILTIKPWLVVKFFVDTLIEYAHACN